MFGDARERCGNLLNWLLSLQPQIAWTFHIRCTFAARDKARAFALLSRAQEPFS